MTDHDPDCATQFSGENSTTHPCTCKKPNPMKIVATEQEIVDAIQKFIVSRPVTVMSISADEIKEALKSLPTLKDELEAFDKWYSDNTEFEITDNAIDRYLATHSKQG